MGFLNGKANNCWKCLWEVRMANMVSETMRTFLSELPPPFTLTQAAAETPGRSLSLCTSWFQDYVFTKFMNRCERTLATLARKKKSLAMQYLPAQGHHTPYWTFSFSIVCLALASDFPLYRSSTDHSNVLELWKYTCAPRKYMIIYHCQLPSVSYINRHLSRPWKQPPAHLYNMWCDLA